MMADGETTLRDWTEADIPGIVGVFVRAYAQPPWNEQNDPAKTDGYVRWLLAQPRTGCVVASQAPAAGALGQGTGGTIAGFVVAGLRDYQDFVGDWERMADRPPAGWPVVPGTLGYVWELAVEPTAQRRGLGAALMSEAISRVREAGADAMLLRSSERAEAAMALYRRFGFERLPVRERVDPRAGPWALRLR
jgi:ribosomal protein S18 acetylase RimI-like enzyme